MKEIRFSVKQLNEIVSSSVQKIISEGYFYDDDDFGVDYSDLDARVDFEDSDFESELNKRYPGMEFEYEIDYDGTVTVTDMNTGNYYTGEGELETENVSLGYPDPRNPYREAEGTEQHFEFTNCLREIMEKIDNGKPDGNSQ